MYAHINKKPVCIFFYRYTLKERITLSERAITIKRLQPLQKKRKHCTLALSSLSS